MEPASECRAGPGYRRLVFALPPVFAFVVLSVTSGCAAVPSGASYLAPEDELLSACPGDRTKVCRAAWASKLRGNQRHYRCYCD